MSTIIQTQLQRILRQHGYTSRHCGRDCMLVLQHDGVWRIIPATERDISLFLGLIPADPPQAINRGVA